MKHNGYQIVSEISSRLLVRAAKKAGEKADFLAASGKKNGKEFIKKYKQTGKFLNRSADKAMNGDKSYKLDL